MTTVEKPDLVEHLEHGMQGRENGNMQSETDGDAVDIHDEQANKRLNRKLDIRIIPLCCWVYLLNFLDRGTF